MKPKRKELTECAVWIEEVIHSKFGRQMYSKEAIRDADGRTRHLPQQGQSIRTNKTYL
jgi:hypothetical protein